jgi:hypothetical protein
MIFRCLAVVVLLALPARAQLAWSRTTAFIYAEPGDPSHMVQFAFKNTGDHAVTIKSLKSNCGCTAPALAKKTYQPGESGEVTAKFLVGDRKGIYLTNVTVTTDEPAAKPVVLQLQPIIRSLADVRPTLVFWRADEAHLAKQITFKVADGQRVLEITANADNPQVKVSVQLKEAGADYAIFVTPDSTAHQAKATIQIMAKLAPAGTRIYQAFVRIK